MSKELLNVENLKVTYSTYAGQVQAVRGVSFSLDKGETIALVGESGCGKSVTAKSIMQLIHEPGKIVEGSKILFEGKNVAEYDPKELAAFRGKDAAIIFQDAMASLNPTMTVGKQIVENILHHNKISKKEAKERAIELLNKVGINNPEQRFKQYPHELSGGMRQRVMIAIAFANDPKLLIADEPTTALDVTIQDQIIELIRKLKNEHDASIILITHDLGVVAGIADRVAVMYGGVIVESGSASDIFYHAKHPYTKALHEAVPRVDEVSGKELVSIAGAPPDLINPPAGCPFNTRCKYCMNICKKEVPPTMKFGEGHEAACFLHVLDELPEDAAFLKD